MHANVISTMEIKITSKKTKVYHIVYLNEREREREREKKMYVGFKKNVNLHHVCLIIPTRILFQNGECPLLCMTLFMKKISRSDQKK